MNSACTQSESLIERRKRVVPHGVGIFVPITARSASNSIITDEDGREFIDFAGGIGVLNAGHCPPPVVAAIQRQAASLMHACFHVSTYAVYVELCELLADLFPHGEETKVMLTNTGAESVENAIKIARQATMRPAILCYTDAFHGRSMMAMSLTSKIHYKLNCGPFAPEVYRLPYPNIYRYGGGLSEAEFVASELARLREAIRSTVAPDAVAAVIIELVQGEGGFYAAPVDYIRGLRQFCDEHGILLIIDEVQTGFCRTGKWAAYMHYGVTPDLSTWAKSMGSGMPIGAVIGASKVMDAAVPATIGGTYLGNPVCCAAALATIRYMKEIDLNAKAMHVSKVISDWMVTMKARFSSIGDVRGLGAMQAFEFVKNQDPLQPDHESCRRLTAACLDRGLLLLSAGTHKNVVRILSPLVISDELLHRGLNIIEEELGKL